MKFKYLKILALLFGLLATGCSEEVVDPGDGDDDEDDIIIHPPPPPPANAYPIDSLG